MKPCLTCKHRYAKEGFTTGVDMCDIHGALGYWMLAYNKPNTWMDMMPTKCKDWVK